MTRTVLPISTSTLSSLAEIKAANTHDYNGTNHSLVLLLQRCDTLELAALSVLHRLYKAVNCRSGKSLKAANMTATKIDRALGVLVDEVQEQGEKARLSLISDLLSVAWQDIAEELPSLGIALMNEQEVHANALQSEQGIWDSAAQQHHAFEEKAPLYRAEYTSYNFNISGIRQHDEQDVLLHELAKNPEESLVLQGFAGSGKTTLVARLSHLFNNYTTLYLTKTMGQIHSIGPKLGSSVKAWTFEYLAHYILYYKWNGKAYWGRRIELRPDHSSLRPLTYHQIARLLNIEGMNGLTAETVAKIVDRIVTNYCASADADIGPQHCPWQLDGLSPTLYIELAKSYWKIIKSPDPLSKIPILGVHQVKIVDENSLAIPPNFRYVIVDESHDLSGSMVSMLQRSPQALVSLGDQFQVTDGKQRQSLEGGNIRERHLFQSIRVGNNVDSVFNQLLSQHTSIALPGAFQGVGARKTTVSTYEEYSPPDLPCAMLSRDYWYAFIAIVQLAQANRPFVVMPGTLSVLQTLIPQALSYLHGFHEQRGHSQLMGYGNWKELVRCKGQSNGLRDVDVFFRKGFTAKHFRDVLSCQTTVYTPDCYYVGLVAEAKSKEMSCVMLAPDIFDAYILDMKEQRTRMLNLIYTGMSRALDNILLPKNESKWLLEA